MARLSSTKKRKDIDKILEKYDMKEYEPYQLLKRSGARLPIDNLFFVDPIFDTSVPFKRVFYIAGSRHYIGCDGRDCNKSINILQGEQLILEREPNNFNDSNAVLVRNKNNQKIGHIPRYFSKSLSELLLNNRDYKCTVLNFDKYNNCNECIRVKLEIM